MGIKEISASTDLPRALQHAAAVENAVLQLSNAAENVLRNSDDKVRQTRY